MISPVGPPGAATGSVVAPVAPGAGEGAGFQNAFEKAVSGVENLRQTADLGVVRFLAGEGGELHSIVLDTQRAELAFELFLQVRNKVVSAYQEIMRTQM